MGADLTEQKILLSTRLFRLMLVSLDMKSPTWSMVQEEWVDVSHMKTILDNSEVIHRLLLPNFVQLLPPFLLDLLSLHVPWTFVFVTSMEVS
jgi:hypothetical protein